VEDAEGAKDISVSEEKSEGGPLSQRSAGRLAKEMKRFHDEDVWNGGGSPSEKKEVREDLR